MISAFKHIRLSGYNVTPVEGGSKLRLGFGGTGLAYYSELTGVSGYLQGLIDTASADVNSVNGLQGNLYVTGGDGISIELDAGLGEIKVVGNSGYFASIINSLRTDLSTNLGTTGSTLDNKINYYSGWATGTYVTKSSNQVFTKTLDAGSDAYAVIYPVPFPYNTIPKVQATLEVDQNSDVMYNLSIRSITSGGYTGLLSDNILEAGAKIHTFASTQ